MLSIVCPIYNEEKYIAKCIDSILQQDYSKDDLEVLFVDGMSTDNTRNIVAQYSAKYPFICLLDNPHKIVPYAMNTGIAAAKGDVVIRLDAHAEYPTDYFSQLVHYLDVLEGAENVGGVCVTLPCSNRVIAIAIAEALSCSFGMGNSYFRTGADAIKSVDTVPFGCFHKQFLKKIGLYDNDLVRNQDDELNGRIIKAGGKIYLIPQIKIKYFARDQIKKVWKMFYQYGLYKPLVNRKLGSPATIRQFFPLLFVLGLIFGVVLSCVLKYFLWVYLFVLGTYLGIGLIIGIVNAFKKGKISLVIFMPIVFAAIHIAYGLGYLDGLFRLRFNRPFSAVSNR